MDVAAVKAVTTSVGAAATTAAAVTVRVAAAVTMTAAVTATVTAAAAAAVVTAVAKAIAKTVAVARTKLWDPPEAPAYPGTVAVTVAVESSSPPETVSPQTISSGTPK